MKFHYITYATHSERYFEQFKKTAEINGINLVILGMGDKWVNFRQKSIAIMKYLENIYDNDVICCMDAFDTLILTNQEEIENKYIKEYQDRKIILFSKDREPSNFIDKEIGNAIFPKECNQLKLNAGLYIGNVGLVKKFWEKYISNLQIDSDDQIYATDECIKNDYVIIDYSHKFFYNMHPNLKNRYKIENRRIKIIKSGEYPCIVSSPVREPLDSELLSNYGLEQIKISKLNNFIKGANLYWKYMIAEILFWILILVSIVIVYNK